MNQPRSVALSCFLYRVVLYLGPPAFRMELESLLLSDFRHLCLDAYAQAGPEGVFALLPRHILRTFCDISGEHFDLIKSRAFKMLQVFFSFIELERKRRYLLERRTRKAHYITISETLYEIESDGRTLKRIGEEYNQNIINMLELCRDREVNARNVIPILIKDKELQEIAEATWRNMLQQKRS